MIKIFYLNCHLHSLNIDEVQYPLMWTPAVTQSARLESKIQREATCAVIVAVAALLALGAAIGLMVYGKVIKFPVKPLSISGYAAAGLSIALFSLSIFCLCQARRNQKEYFTNFPHEPPPHQDFDNLDTNSLIELSQRKPPDEMVPLLVARAKEVAIPLEQIPRAGLTLFLQLCAEEILRSDRQPFVDEYKIIQGIILHHDPKPLITLSAASMKFWENHHDLLLHRLGKRDSFGVNDIQNHELRRLLT